jgi:hypothetical protein
MSTSRSRESAIPTSSDTTTATAGGTQASIRSSSPPATAPARKHASARTRGRRSARPASPGPGVPGPASIVRFSTAVGTLTEPSARTLVVRQPIAAASRTRVAYPLTPSGSGVVAAATAHAAVSKPISTPFATCVPKAGPPLRLASSAASALAVTYAASASSGPSTEASAPPDSPRPRNTTLPVFIAENTPPSARKLVASITPAARPIPAPLGERGVSAVRPARERPSPSSRQ